MKLISRVFAVLLYHLLKVVPRSNNIVVFGSEFGRSFRGNPKYLYKRMSKISALRCIYILKNKQAVTKAVKQGYECYYYLSLKGLYFQLRAKYVIHSHSITEDLLKILLGGATSVNTWHGCGPKKVWAANYNSFTYKALHEKNRVKKFFKMILARTNLAKVNYVLCTSEAFKAIYPDTFLVNKENVLQLGQARNDVFFDDSLEDDNIPEFLKKEKVILYMPTFRNLEKGTTDVKKTFNLNKINNFCAKYNYKFVIKKHMHDTIMGDVEGLENIIDISAEDNDSQMLLKYADVLVTDYSSCYADYLLLNRPIVFYCYDYKNYLTRDRELYFNYDEVTPGPKALNFEDFLTELEKTVTGKDSYEGERKRVLDFLYAKENQGPVLEKQVNYIVKNIIKL